MNITILKKNFFLILAFIIFVVLLVISEFIYKLNNQPEAILGYFLKNLSSLSLPIKKLDYTQQKTTSLFLYKYLEIEEKRVKNFEPCDPLCFSYAEFQNLLRLFERVENTNSFEWLNPKQKSKLYFWMAVMNVWHDDDQKTLEFLKKSASLSNNNVEVNAFYEDFKKISNLANNPNSRAYFKKKLNSTNKIKQYEEKYLAKAAFELANYYLSDGNIKDAELYFNKSITINPWRLNPYLMLSKIYISQQNKKGSKTILEKCISYLKKDSLPCKQKLAIVN